MIKKKKKRKLTNDILISEAKTFCLREATYDNPELYVISDNATTNHYIKRKFFEHLNELYNFDYQTDKGISFPEKDINTNILVVSKEKPESMCVFKNAMQKIYGLGFNVILFIYEKEDNHDQKASRISFKKCAFIEKERTADYDITFQLIQMIENDAQKDDIIGFLMDHNMPADELKLNHIAEQILINPPKQGYFGICYPMKWELKFGKFLDLKEQTGGITDILE